MGCFCRVRKLGCHVHMHCPSLESTNWRKTEYPQANACSAVQPEPWQAALLPYGLGRSTVLGFPPLRALWAVTLSSGRTLQVLKAQLFRFYIATLVVTFMLSLGQGPSSGPSSSSGPWHHTSPTHLLCPAGYYFSFSFRVYHSSYLKIPKEDLKVS